MEVRAESTVSLLLGSGADVKSCRDQGETVLHRAVVRRAGGMVKLLLEKGADMEAVNNLGVTSLGLARRTDSGLGIVELMMGAKTSMGERDDEGGGVLLLETVHNKY